MKLYLKRTSAETGALFLVFGENGKIVYRIAGDRSPFLDTICVIYEGKVAAKIQRVGAVTLSKYNVFVDGTKRFGMIQEFAGTCPRFLFQGVRWKLRGDMALRSFDLIDVDGSVLMTHGRCWSACGDCYGLSFFYEELVLPCLCAAVVVDSLAQNGGRAVVIPSG